MQFQVKKLSTNFTIRVETLPYNKSMWILYDKYNAFLSDIGVSVGVGQVEYIQDIS